MSTADTFLAGPWGVVVAIFGMMAITYFCRASGLVIMSRVRITPRIERGLRALPGSIILATILPVVIDSGWPAMLALAATIVTMAVTRIDMLSLAAGLGSLAVIRAFL